jgi:hypothetical protein
LRGFLLLPDLVGLDWSEYREGLLRRNCSDHRASSVLAVCYWNNSCTANQANGWFDSNKRGFADEGQTTSRPFQYLLLPLKIG